MAIIQPFRGLRPHTDFADRLVFETPALRGLLATGACQLPDTLDYLLKRRRLLQDNKPGIYIYESSREGCSQSGVWALADLSAPLLSCAVAATPCPDFLRDSRVEGDPILLTHQPNADLAELTEQLKRRPPDLSYDGPAGIHRLWRVTAKMQIRRFQQLFGQVRPVYLTGAYPRLAAARTQRRPVLSALFIGADGSLLPPEIPFGLLLYRHDA